MTEITLLCAKRIMKKLSMVYSSNTNIKQLFMENISDTFIEISNEELTKYREDYISSQLYEDMTFDEYLLDLGIKRTDDER